MSKAAAIDAIVESAICHFARDGYAGASLRDIAADADVPLSSIDRYFGSKIKLFRGVIREVWSEVERERATLLKQAIAASGGAKPGLDDLILALATPIVRRALSNNAGDVARTFLLRNPRSDGRQQRSLSGKKLSDADTSLARWVDALQLSCPTLTREDVVWTFSFLSGLIYSRQLIDRRYDALFPYGPDRSVNDVARDIATFGRAGIEALVQRRAGQVAIQTAVAA